MCVELVCVLLAMQAGDKVVYSKYAGTEITVEGNEHVLLKASPVLPLGLCLCAYIAL